MGMYDVIFCEYALPDPEVQEKDFQTKDLECELKTFTISKEGFLLCQCGDRDWGQWHNTGELRFYTSVGENNLGPDYVWYEYEAVFEKGVLKSLKRVSK